MAGVFVLVLWNGIHRGLARQKGWFAIVAGFGLLASAGLLDITDNFPELNRFVVVGDTPAQAFLEKIVGYFGGFVLLFIGFSAWFPSIIKFNTALAKLREESDSLEKTVADRTADLLSTNTTLRDEIHERRTAEEALQKSRMNLLTAQRIANLGYWERDIQSGLLTWSERIYEIFDRDPKKFVPTYDHFLKCLHPDDRERVKSTSLQSLYEKKPYDTEYRIVRPDGEVRYVHARAETSYDDNGTPLTSTGVIIDITAQVRARMALESSEKRFRDIADIASDWIWEMDADLRYTYFSDRLYEVLGVSVKNAIGKTRAELATDQDEESFNRHLADMEEHRSFRNFVYNILDDDGNLRAVRISGRPIFDEDGTFMGYRGTGSDITAETEARNKLAQANVQLAELANNDPLTGLPNRRNFENHFRRAILRSRRSGKGGALLYLDLSKFKDINDTYGHDHGDWALQEVSQRIGSALREVDIVARLGGDEFCVILEEINSEAGAAQVAEKIIAAISKPCVHLGAELTLGASIGIVFFSGDDQEERIKDILRNADQAMYRAKRDGGNVFRFYAPGLDDRSSADRRA